jgi:hypothetical protein
VTKIDTLFDDADQARASLTDETLKELLVPYLALIVSWGKCCRGCHRSAAFFLQPEFGKANRPGF